MGSTSLSSLANRVRALKRKLHRPYTEYFVGHEVNQLCEEWADAQSQNKPLPDPHNFIRKVADSGFHYLSFTGAFGYLDYCHRRKKEPPTSCSSTPSCPGVNPPVSPSPNQPEKCPRMSEKVPAP